MLIEGFRKFRLQRVAGVKAATECEEQSISVLHNTLFCPDHHRHYHLSWSLLSSFQYSILSLSSSKTSSSIMMIMLQSVFNNLHNLCQNLASSIHYTFLLCLCTGTWRTSTVWLCSHVKTAISKQKLEHDLTVTLVNIFRSARASCTTSGGPARPYTRTR